MPSYYVSFLNYNYLKFQLLKCTVYTARLCRYILLTQDQDLRVHNKTNTPTSSSSIIQDTGNTSEHDSPTLPGLGGHKNG